MTAECFYLFFRDHHCPCSKPLELKIIEVKYVLITKVRIGYTSLVSFSVKYVVGWGLLYRHM